MTSDTTRDIGFAAEKLAQRYLEQQGLVYVTHHYQCALGEIDLIMQEQDLLIFVEVRLRKNKEYGSGVETVTRPKQRKIINTALHYLQSHNLYDKIACRIDIVDISFHNTENHLEWFKNAILERW